MMKSTIAQTALSIGTLAVCLLLSGCTNEPTTVDFTGDPVTGDAPLTVYFHDDSISWGAPMDNWTWDFGDGGSSGDENPSHTYTTPGTYDVTLGVHTESGQMTIKPKLAYITVGAGPKVDFIADVTAGRAPLEVQFGDFSTAGDAPITIWYWSFGDGEISSEQNPSHTYTVPGCYPVTLRIVQENNKTSMTEKANYINVAAGKVAGGPTAEFDASPETGAAPLEVTFTNASTPGDSPLWQYLWTFGDGGTAITKDAAHTYAKPGIYDVSLKVTAVNLKEDIVANTGLIVVSEP